MKFNIRIEIVEEETQLRTEIRIPALSCEEFSKLELPIGKLFQDGNLFFGSTSRLA